LHFITEEDKKPSTMFEETRKNIGLSLTRLLFRRKAAHPTSFSNIFTKAQTALVILPVKPELRNIVIPVLTQLQNKFQGTRLTLVGNEMYRSIATTFIRSSVITIKNDSLNYFFLPKRSEVNTLLHQRFDVVVDLNTTDEPVAAYLCRGLSAPLKVGFHRTHADSYYNFQYKIGGPRDPRALYEQLFKTLSMF
jgi:hypothetical protein